MNEKHMFTPGQLKELYPLSNPESVQLSRNELLSCLHREDSRTLIVVGPCSLHDVESVLEYGRRLKNLSTQIEDRALIIMRAYFEKPRTTVGWKGLLYDPDLNGNHNLKKGLCETRSLLLELTKLGLPLAAEFLDPIVAPYFSDLITWGVIGSRSCTSQIHRQLASSLPMPVGIKHGTEGSFDGALNAMIASANPHHFFGINDAGKLCAQNSSGNPATHLILRGSSIGPNYEADAVSEAIYSLKSKNLNTRILIDCSHGNSGKDHTKQPEVFENVMQQIADGNEHIMGIMLESHLKPGKELSITDSCIGWETTEKLLLNQFDPHLLAPIS